MGTWAVDAFGNDYAQDWAEDLAQTSGLDAVEGALDMVLDAGADAGSGAVDGAGELAAPFAAEALVAIEVLARLQGKGGARGEDSAAVDHWVERCKPRARPRADLTEKAGRALTRILSEHSELRELWAESEHYSAWLAAVEELRARLVS